MSQTARPGLGRYQSMAPSQHPSMSMEEFALKIPDFLSKSQSIPSTVTARGYDKSMPVAYEPEITPRRKVLVAAPTSEASPPAATDEKGSKISLPPGFDRRSTMPLHKAVPNFLTSPPYLFPTLVPNCDICSSDPADSGSVANHAHDYCVECDLHFCGLFAMSDGLPVGAHNAAAALARPRGCNLRMHTRRIMQDHVRIPASVKMALEKRVQQHHEDEGEEKASHSSSQSNLLDHSKSTKQLLLDLFGLGMRGICWQYQSQTHNESSKPGDPSWIQFDLPTQAQLESNFIEKQQPKSKVRLTEQYEVTSSSGDESSSKSSKPQMKYFLLNTITLKRVAVRRLEGHSEDYIARMKHEERVAEEEKKATLERLSAPSSAVNSPSAATSSHYSHASTPTYGGGQFSPSSSETSYLHRSHPLPALDTSATSTMKAPLSSSRRPALARNASMDEKQIAVFEEYTEDAWRNFAKSTSKLHEGDLGTAGTEVAEITDPAHVEKLFPLWDLEKGNALLLAIYHNCFTATLALLKKGYSVNSLTSWTRFSALMVCCIRGNHEIAELLVQHGADLSYKNNSTKLCIEHAVRSGNRKLVEYLLQFRAEDDENGKTRSHSQRLVAYSDILLREARRNKFKKRSTWIDIAADEDEVDAAKGGPEAASSRSGKVSQSPPIDNTVGDSTDPDAGLYPHLLTNALIVDAEEAHSTEVMELLLDRMLQRSQESSPPPHTELSRYIEWLTMAITSGSVERVGFLLHNWSRYTASLDIISDAEGPRSFIEVDFKELFSRPEYGHGIVSKERSVQLGFMQCCSQIGVLQSTLALSPGDVGPDEDFESESSTSSYFAILRLLLKESERKQETMNQIFTEESDGTQLCPLFLAIRERKEKLVSFLLRHGCSLETVVRVSRLDGEPSQLDRANWCYEDVDRGLAEVVSILSDDGEEPVYYRRMDWRAYAQEECGIEGEEFERLVQVIKYAIEAK